MPSRSLAVPLRSSRTVYAGLSVFAVLLMPAARGWAAGPTQGQKCSYAKTQALGKYYACVLSAEGKAFKKNLVPDVTTCDQNVHSAFAKIEAKYGSMSPNVCGDFDPFDHAYLISKTRRDSLQMACLAIDGEGIDRGGTITVVDFATDRNPTTLAVRNTTNSPIQHGKCFYVDATCSHSQEFTIDVPAQGAVAWDPSNPPAGIPALPSPSFAGNLVCVNVDSSGIPEGANSLIASVADQADCPVDGAIIRTFASGVDQGLANSQLCLGSPISTACPAGAELDPCPYDLFTGTPFKPAMEGCWSSASSFTYHCQQ